jgi:hypothetical protein
MTDCKWQKAEGRSFDDIPGFESKGGSCAQHSSIVRVDLLKAVFRRTSEMQGIGHPEENREEAWR